MRLMSGCFQNKVIGYIKIEKIYNKGEHNYEISAEINENKIDHLMPCHTPYSYHFHWNNGV